MRAVMDQLTVHTREDGDKFVCVWKVGRKQGMVFVRVEADVRAFDSRDRIGIDPPGHVAEACRVAGEVPVLKTTPVDITRVIPP